MNTYHNLLFLTNSLSKLLLQASFQKAYSIYKNQIDLVFLCENGQTKRLIFCTNPSVTCLFLDDDRPTRLTNITYFFEQLHNLNVSYIQTIENERVVSIEFEDGTCLVFKLYGNRPNIYLFNKNDETPSDSFKKEQLSQQKSILLSPKKAKFPDIESVPDHSSPKDVLVGLIPTLNRQYLKAIIQEYRQAPELIELAQQIKSELEQQSAAYNVMNDGSVTSISNRFLPTFEVAKSFEEVNEAIKWSFLNQASTKNFSGQKDQLINIFASSIRKKGASLAQLESPEIAQERANQYESKAHSLMAYGFQLNWAAITSTTVKLPSTEFASELIEIEIDPKLNAVKNAEKLYGKARYNRSRIKDYEAMASNLNSEIAALTAKLADVDGIKDLNGLKDWQKNHKPLIAKLQNSAKQDVAELPFRVIRFQDIEVWVGKNAKSNDELVRAAHKEDIWLHARGVAGSHVLIRMNNQKDFPLKHVIEAVAQVAAFYSKLKGSALVPVSYAKKKFVRKPKGAPPGLVVMDKEETMLVEPKQQLAW